MDAFLIHAIPRRWAVGRFVGFRVVNNYCVNIMRLKVGGVWIFKAFFDVE